MSETCINGEHYSKVVTLLGGDAFIVPCMGGTKKPKCKYVDFPFERTLEDDWLTMCRAHDTNLAIYLGKASHGLCAVDCDSDEDLAAFLAVNPKLEGTLRTRGSRGGMVWMWIQGDYPESCSPDHHHFEWRADRRLSTICGRHPKGMHYVYLVDAPPVALPFAEIVWPEGWELPWLKKEEDTIQKRVTKVYGEPFYLSKSGAVTGINERFWAALYAAEHTLLFDASDRHYWTYDAETGLWGIFDEDLIREQIAARIFEVRTELGLMSLEVQITQTKLRNVMSALRSMVLKRGVFTGRKAYVHVSNCVIRFEADGIVETGFSPEDYSRNRSPFPYDPEAGCPRFLHELIYAAVKREDVGLLQRWFGLALFGYNLPQRFLILEGLGNTGKGTFVKIVQALVGVENTSQLRTQHLNERFELYRFRAKTLLIGSDVPGKFLQEEGASVLKSLVGGDPLEGEGKGTNETCQMFGTFNVVITSNERLRLRVEGDAGAWRRRLLIVRYENPPPQLRILDFDRVLLAEEGPGILRWALQGFIRLRAEFKTHGDFILTPAQSERIDSLLAESESLAVFVKERLVADEWGTLTQRELCSEYGSFCEERGWVGLPDSILQRESSDTVFRRWRKTKVNSLKGEGKSEKGWNGLRLKTQEELDREEAPEFLVGEDGRPL